MSGQSLTSQAAREAMLSRVRGALGRTGPPTGAPAAPAVDDSLMRICRKDADLAGVFVKNANGAGMKARRVPMASLSQTISGLLRDANARSVASGIAPGPVAQAAAEACRGVGAALLPPARPTTDIFASQASITDVHAAVAETPSLAFAADGHHPRAAWIVAPVHIAVVPASKIVADLLDLWTMRSLPAAFVLVSGPSKTADIEGILITGVHGPGLLHVIVVDDL